MIQILEIPIAILIFIVRFIVGDDPILVLVLLRVTELIIVRALLMKPRVK